MSLEVRSLRALAHPLRMQMLSLLTGAAMSAAELARELDITNANASYHLRTLAAAGLVVGAGEERIRGGVAKRYRYIVEAPAVSATGRPPARALDRQLFWRAMAAELIRRSELAMSGRGENTDAELWVDPDVWAQVLRQVSAASQLLHAQARPPRAPGTVRVSMTTAMFEMRSRR